MGENSQPLSAPGRSSGRLICWCRSNSTRTNQCRTTAGRWPWTDGFPRSGPRCVFCSCSVRGALLTLLTSSPAPAAQATEEGAHILLLVKGANEGTNKTILETKVHVSYGTALVFTGWHAGAGSVDGKKEPRLHAYVSNEKPLNGDPAERGKESSIRKRMRADLVPISRQRNSLPPYLLPSRQPKPPSSQARNFSRKDGHGRKWSAAA